MQATDVVGKIRELFEVNGGSEYGGERVTQLEHALQAATFAELSGADDALIAAALLHDIGHLLHDLPDDAPDRGVDDVHENLGNDWLLGQFGPEVTEPVRMHVDAKRYLCAVEPSYLDELSPPSRTSLELQGGPMDAEEVQKFQDNPFYSRGVQLRRWDDRAKIVGFQTPALDHFLECVSRVRLQQAAT